MADQQPEAGQGTVPSWVDRLVEGLVRDFQVVAGPAGTVLLGRAGDEKVKWANAADMETSVFDDPDRTIRGPQKKAILSRLRRQAHQRIGWAPFHPMTTDEGRIRHNDSDGAWYYEAANGTRTMVALDGHNSLVNAHNISKWGATTRLGLSTARGDWLRVHGTLLDGAVAYPLGAGDLGLVIPCPRGESRSVIMVVEQEVGLAVRGFTIERPDVYGAKPEFRSYEGGARQSYFALWIDDKGTQKVRVLKVPD